MTSSHSEVELFDRKYVYTSAEKYLFYNKNRGRLFFTDQKLDIKYHIVKNCLVAGEFGQQLIPIENNKSSNIIFTESFVYDHDDSVRKSLLYNIFYQEKDFDFVSIDEAVSLYHVWSSNFWHWTFECLIKMLALEARGYTGKYIVFNDRFVLEYFELFNICRERICHPDKNYIVKHLIIPSTFTGHELSQYSIEYLRRKIIDAAGRLSGNNHIYIKRTKGRIVANEDEVLDVLKNYDFTIIIPEEYSVKEQFLLMTNSNLSIMAHGANCTLTLAQKKKSTFMELFSRRYIEYHTIPIIKTLNLEYIPLVENKRYPAGTEQNQSAQSCNITVPIRIFEALVDNISKKYHNF